MLANTSHQNSINVAQVKPERLDEILKAKNSVTYAVLDACDEPKIPILVEQLKDHAVSLYKGRAEQDCWDIAPYIVVVDSVVLDWVRENLWGQPWGFFATSTSDLLALRKHFRRFLLVDGPADKELYFRFYDPRVLRPFLESSAPSKVKQFFGPIDACYTVNSDQEVFELKPSLETKSPSVVSSNRKLLFDKPEMDAYADARRANFVNRLADQIMPKLQELGQSLVPEKLKEQINVGISRALEYEMNLQRDIARYVEASIVGLGRFEAKQDPIVVQNILLDRRVDWPTRLERFEMYTAEKKTISVGEEKFGG